jgi:hypothetical protein
MSKILVDTIDTRSGTSNITIGSSNVSQITLKSGATLTNFPGVPAFAVRKTDGNQAYSQATATKVTFNNEFIDTNSAFADSKFTVPSGQAGVYQFNVSIRMGTIAADSGMSVFLYVNGSEYTPIVVYITDESENPVFGGVQALDLSASDYVEVYASTNGGGGNFFSNGCQFTGFRLGT